MTGLDTPEPCGDFMQMIYADHNLSCSDEESLFLQHYIRLAVNTQTSEFCRHSIVQIHPVAGPVAACMTW
jgi:hypothetical protein